MSGETCPEGTVPIRRTNEQDLLRASSITRFGRKIGNPIRRDTSSDGHEVSAMNNRQLDVLINYSLSFVF